MTRRMRRLLTPLLLAATLPAAAGTASAQQPDSVLVPGERIRVHWDEGWIEVPLQAPGPLLTSPAESAASTLPDCEPGDGPAGLRVFAALAVGEWVNEESRHVFAWAEDSTAIRSRSFFPADTGWTPVSTGCWWWDQAAGTVRGEVHTRNMPFDRMEYRSEVERGRVVHALRTHGERTEEFVEIWTFDGGEYRWALYAPGQLNQPIMEGRYRRAVRN